MPIVPIRTLPTQREAPPGHGFGASFTVRSSDVVASISWAAPTGRPACTTVLRSGWPSVTSASTVTVRKKYRSPAIPPPSLTGPPQVTGRSVLAGIAQVTVRATGSKTYPGVVSAATMVSPAGRASTMRADCR